MRDGPSPASPFRSAAANSSREVTLLADTPMDFAKEPNQCPAGKSQISSEPVVPDPLFPNRKNSRLRTP